MQNSEIEVAENATRAVTGVTTGQNSLLRPDEARQFNALNQRVEEQHAIQDDNHAEYLLRQELIIQTSEVLYPRNNFFNNVGSLSVGKLIKSSPIALFYLTLTAEAVAGIACYCSAKFPENAMNGANITGANFTGANILRNATETRDECIQEKMPYVS